MNVTAPQAMLDPRTASNFLRPHDTQAREPAIDGPYRRSFGRYLNLIGCYSGLPPYALLRRLRPGAAGAPGRSPTTSAGKRRIRPRRADRLAQPVRDGGLQRVADGGSLAGHLGTGKEPRSVRV